MLQALINFGKKTIIISITSNFFLPDVMILQLLCGKGGGSPWDHIIGI
jgi:hypothetical protein